MAASADKDRAQTRERVGAMTLQEKIGLMSGRSINKLLLPVHYLFFKQYNRSPYHTNEVPRLSVPAVKFCDGPRGVVSGRSTCFPVAMARGATFDTQLEAEVGRAIAREVIAAGGNFFGGVCINLLRHPAWGRAQETYGEDPCLLSEMGVAITRGVQELGVMACLKHFALNSMENARFNVDVSCSERTLREVYLPHFKACVDAGAASVMTAYNKVNGAYCGQNRHLLRDTLKGEWDFTGFVISDFVWGFHDTAEAANAGMDIEMPWPNHFGKKLLRATRAGQVDQRIIDEAARRIVDTVSRFDEVLVQQTVDPSVVAGEEHRLLARTVAEKSMTLLKNADGVLPLQRKSLQRLALFGELAEQDNCGDHGSSKVVPPFVVTPRQGLEALLGTDVIVDYCDGSDLDEVARLSAAADAVVLVVGNRPTDEGEYIVNRKNSPGGDRDQLGLRAAEVAMIKSAASANSNTTAVLIGGSAITLAEWQEDAAAILFAYYPGMEGGHALARTLLGEVSPGGKLPFTIAGDPSQLPFFDKNADAIEYGYYHGYTLFDKNRIEPAYAFGFGLSYTRFELLDARFSTANDELMAEVTVKNSGDRAGDEVVQLYIGCSRSEVDRPDKVLRAFERITLSAGDSARVVLTAGFDSLRWFDESAAQWRFEALPYEVYIGTSSRRQDLHCGVVDLSDAGQQ